MEIKTIKARCIDNDGQTSYLKIGKIYEITLGTISYDGIKNRTEHYYRVLIPETGYHKVGKVFRRSRFVDLPYDLNKNIKTL